MKSFRFRLAAILLFLLPITAHGQWFPSNSPAGVSTQALVRYGPEILAGTSAGIFATSNQGGLWTSTNPGYLSTSVLSLTIVDTVILAGTGGQTVYRSTDGGSNWSSSGNGIYSTIYFENNTVRSLITAAGSVLAGTGGGVFKSTDTGVNWVPSSVGLTNKNVSALESDGLYLYAGTAGGGAFRSTNGGESWSTINEGLSGTYITTIEKIGSVLFAGTRSAGIFRSTDHGSTWNDCNVGLDTLLIHGLGTSGANILAGTDGGIFTSSNGGDTWVRAGGLCSKYRAFDFSGGSDITLAATEAGIMASSDGGVHWTAMNAGLTYMRVYSLHACDSTIVAGFYWPGVIVLNSDGSLCSAFDTTASTSGPKAIAGNMDGLFAGTWGGGVVHSTNGGLAWTSVSAGLPSPYVNALLEDGTMLFAATLQGVFRSTDFGAHWTDATAGMGSVNVYSLASNGTDFFAGTSSNVYKSTDEGASWGVAGTGLPPTYVNALALIGEELFAGTYSSEVYRLTNGSTEWTLASNGLPNASLITSFAAHGQILFVGTSDGVFMTTNNGANWSSINEGLSDLIVNSLAVEGRFLVAGTMNRGIFLRPLSDVTTSVPGNSERAPGEFVLFQNFPNPFNPSTVIPFHVGQSGHIRISVTDVLGREVGVLADAPYPPGKFSVVFNGSGFATGTYFCTMHARDVVLIRKLLIVR